MATTKVRVTYTEQENEAIAAYAQSSAAKDGEVTVRSARDTAIAAHRALFARVRETGGTLPYGNAHFEFMREVDTPARSRDEDGDMATTMTVDFSNYEVRYRSKDTTDLEQAWACTVHKSQGCEFPVVIFVCPYSHRIMLTRNLVYTAVTRAKAECIVVGEERTLRDAVDTIDRSRRYTGLQDRLRSGDAPEPARLPKL